MEKKRKQIARINKTVTFWNCRTTDSGSWSTQSLCGHASYLTVLLLILVPKRPVPSPWPPFRLTVRRTRRACVAMQISRHARAVTVAPSRVGRCQSRRIIIVTGAHRRLLIFAREKKTRRRPVCHIVLGNNLPIRCEWHWHGEAKMPADAAAAVHSDNEGNEA